MSVNPFDDDNGSFFVLINDKNNTAYGQPLPMSPTAGGWSTARQHALTAWTTSNRTGPISGPKVCVTGLPSNRRATKRRYAVSESAASTRSNTHTGLSQDSSSGLS